MHVLRYTTHLVLETVEYQSLNVSIAHRSNAIWTTTPFQRYMHACMSFPIQPSVGTFPMASPRCSRESGAVTTDILYVLAGGRHVTELHPPTVEATHMHAGSSGCRRHSVLQPLTEGRKNMNDNQT